jgi:hypothetical protein
MAFSNMIGLLPFNDSQIAARQASVSPDRVYGIQSIFSVTISQGTIVSGSIV